MIETVGTIKTIRDNTAFITADIKGWLAEKQEIKNCRVIYDDGRTISADQRKKVYATLKDIADHTGYFPEEAKEFLKYDYIEMYGKEYFSLSDCTMTQATDFISFLIDFCFIQNIPTRDTLLNRTDDINHYLYSCLVNRKCCICNEKGEIHHCEGSKVGMGFNRNKINNKGRRAICLCRKHHNQAHNDERGFFEKYKVYGIELDDYLLRKLKL